jgi:hypothetical protein
MGRGGMLVLRTVPWAVHVCLSGPRDASIQQGAALEAIDRAAARERQESEDKARIGYGASRTRTGDLLGAIQAAAQRFRRQKVAICSTFAYRFEADASGR